MMTLDIIGWGALNVDRLCMVDEFAPSDGETFINDEKTSCGGSAANTIIAIAKQGLQTGYIGKVGTDSNAELMLNYIEAHDVNTDGIIVSPGQTGEVLGFVDKSGDRKLYVTPQVNDTITTEEVDLDYIRSSKMLHLTSFVGLKDDSTSIETQLEVLSEVCDDVTVSFDPGLLYVQRGQEFMANLIGYTDILLINEQELKLTTGLDDLEQAVMEISPLVDTLVVKRSNKGSLVVDDGDKYVVDIFNVDTVDTTGAGDAYNGGFLYGLLEGYTTEESALIASYIAAQSTTQTGATEAIPTLDDETLKTILNR